MTAIFFSVLLFLALSSICSEIWMRIRVTQLETRDKIAWWRRSGNEVAATYKELFPLSKLPHFRRFVFWFFLACCGGLLLILWKSR